MSGKIGISERLFNLTCALLYTQRGLTKHEIFSTVQGYKERFVFGEDNAALDRMFERDKTSLTEAGIHWRTRVPSESSEDNIDFRYLIANDDYQWPKGQKLTAKQVALMNLAAKAWANAALSDDANKGIIRIRAMGEPATTNNLIGIAPRIRTHESSFLPISQAIETRTVVTFDYRKAGSTQVTTRTVEPWSLQSISGQWLLVAFDRDKQLHRNFLLRRICSPVTETKFDFEVPSVETLEAALLDLKQHTENHVAKILIPRDSAAWFHFNLGQEDIDDKELAVTHKVPYMDLHLLAEELMEFISEIEILEPAQLSDLIRMRFEKVAELHG